MAAKRATLMERSKKMSNAGEFDEEVDKVIKFLRLATMYCLPLGCGSLTSDQLPKHNFD